MANAHGELKSWMQAADLQVRTDEVGNLIGTWGPPLEVSSRKSVDADRTEGIDEARNVLMIGSHLDTVVNAGRFDGMLGVLLGLGVVEALQEMQVALPLDIDVIGFSEEEGVRFGFPFIGSRGITGTFDPADFDRVDINGVSMREALLKFGCQPDQFLEASYFPQDRFGRRMTGFLEAHLEQAVALEQSGHAVGPVSAIAGQTRASIFLQGISGHAGTVVHGQRRDALAAAASLILDIEQLGNETEGLFATVGKIIALPGLSNVIPGQVELLLDVRHADDEVRLQTMKTISLMLLEIKATRDVVGSITSQSHTAAVPMDAMMTDFMVKSLPEQNRTAPVLVSGAGHDAMVLARSVRSGMLFIRCRDGISHHPDELVSPADICIALQTLAGTVLKFADHASSDKVDC